MLQRPSLLIRMVPAILVTSLCGDPCLETCNGGDVMCCREFPGETVAGHHRTDILEPAVWSRMMLATLARRPRQSANTAGDLGFGQSIMNPGQQPERTGSAGV